MNIQDLRDNGLIIFEAMVGSQSYGTATETSDVDVKGVFIMPLDGLMNFDYVEQVSDETNDTTFYEMKRFLELVHVNNPTVMELLNTPKDCVIYKDPIFDMVLNMKDQLISKLCRYTFGGYAVEQIRKAKGLNKKIVKPMGDIRKGVLDFCYVSYKQGSLPVKEYLMEMYPDWRQEHVSLVAISHMRYTYGAYLIQGTNGKHPKGIVHDEIKSNDISLSEVPKGIEPNFIMFFNKDAYSSHCKEFNEYQDWVKKRNKQRFSDNMLHNGGYDGKNLAHCHRLLDVAIEIGEGKGINIRRENREQLLAIRRGEYSYEQLISEANEKIEKLKEVFESKSCTLPENVDFSIINALLLDIRKKYYTRVKISLTS